MLREGERGEAVVAKFLRSTAESALILKKKARERISHISRNTRFYLYRYQISVFKRIERVVSYLNEVFASID